jgi:hypothetical protein
MPFAEEDYFFACPYCFSEIAIRLDATAGSVQRFTQDCEVCCRPIEIKVGFGQDGVIDFEAVPES